MSEKPAAEQLSRRGFILAAGVAAACLAPEPAGAHGLTGKWKVSIRWPERIAAEVIWTVNSGGGFTSSDGFNGVWAQRGSLVVFAVNGGSAPSYAGNLTDDLTLEGIAVHRNGTKGYWAAELQP